MGEFDNRAGAEPSPLIAAPDRSVAVSPSLAQALRSLPALIVLIVGISLMIFVETRDPPVSPLVRIAATASVVTLGLLLWIVADRSARRQSEFIRKVVKAQRAMSLGPHQVRPATDSDYRAGQREYLDTVSKELSLLGFTPLPDEVEVSLEQSGASHPVLRSFVHPDGFATCNAGQVKMQRGLSIRTFSALWIGTEFSDGSIFVTSSGTDLMVPNNMPGVEEVRLAQGIAASELYRRHQARITKKIAGTPSASIVLVKTRDDLRQAHERAMIRRREKTAATWYVNLELIEHELRLSKAPEWLIKRSISNLTAEARRQALAAGDPPTS